MTRLNAFLILLALWAAIYLPGLGSTELKGEEGRRILPAVTMLETGNWLVPYVGGKPFLRKPPLMNWLIAGSFKITGVRSEWTARLPSALAVLALGATIVGVAGSGWMKPRAALSAAVMAISTFGLLAKARFAGAEIEGVYVPLFGIAMVWWLAGWARGWSPWKLWLVPAIFLGLAALAKGPLHLLFFYGIVIAVCWAEKRWRALVHPAHLIGLALIVAIFAAWAVPYFRTEAAGKATKVWRDQMANRVTENRFEWGSYLTNLPRGLGDLLPWVLFAPVVYCAGRKRDASTDSAEASPIPAERVASPGEAKPQVIKAVLLASGVLYVGLLLVPGILPRYVLPLAVPLAAVLALYVERTNFCRWVLRVGVILGVAMTLGATARPFVLGFVDRHAPGIAAFAASAAKIFRVTVDEVQLASKIQEMCRDDLRPLAAEIDGAIAHGATLTLYDPEYQAWIFYLRSKYEYAPYLENIPPDARYVLARGGDKARRKFSEKRSDLALTRTFKGREGAEFLLYERTAKP